MVVGPSFRPDKAVNIHKDGFLYYMELLAKSVGKEKLETMQEVCDALVERLEYFHARGRKVSDHGLDYVPFQICTMEEANETYQKALRGEKLTVAEVEGYQTTILLCLGKAYSRLGIAMQLHYSCLRNTNQRMFETLGPDAGFDAIAQNTTGANIFALLSALDETEQCPKTILYSLNPNDNASIGTIIGCFQGTEAIGKIQQGSGWWFNDQLDGMVQQMNALSLQGLLSRFVGMLTDSRSFVSYPRHEYFRRILCDLIGKDVEAGLIPESEMKRVEDMVEDICYWNAERYFRF